MKEYKVSPLPFQGQKRNFIKHFKQALLKADPNATYVDLFGGSGLLSHTVKSIFPNSKVVYNDFDDFNKRLKNINITNKIIEALREVLMGQPKNVKIEGELRNKVINVLRNADAKGYVDYITLSSSLLFSMNYVKTLAELEKETIYCKVRKSNYVTTDYLRGVDIVKSDYRLLFEKYKTENVVFLVDPPYLSTNVDTYNKVNYWSLTNYLDVLDTVVSNNYFYFTSNKSQIVELCEWIEKRHNLSNPFYQANKVEIKTSTSHNASYTDIMLYKWNTTISQ